MAIDFSILLFALVFSVKRYKVFDFASKILTWLLLLTVVNEILAVWCSHVYRNSYIIYGLFNPIQFYLICWYFNRAIPNFRHHAVGIKIGVIVSFVGIIDYLFIETPYKMNIYFLLFESISVIGLCMYSFYRMLLNDDDLRLVTHPHFWITTIFLFFWTSTFLFWGVYDYVRSNIAVNEPLLYSLLFWVNIVTYTAFGFVFMLYSKMKKTNG